MSPTLSWLQLTADKGCKQDIAGNLISIEDSEEVCTQIVGKTLSLRPRRIGLRLYRRTLSLYNVTMVLFADLLEHDKYKGGGALFMFFRLCTFIRFK